MQKDKFEPTELEIIRFHAEDVIMTSNESIPYEEDELPLINSSQP